MPTSMNLFRGHMATKVLPRSFYHAMFNLHAVKTVICADRGVHKN